MKRSLLVLLLVCLTAFALSAGAEGAYTPGTYTGEGTGRNGSIVVDVTVSENRIESIEVKEQAETPDISTLPLERIPQEVVEYQSLGVDSIAGATITSAGVKMAISNALEQAGADVAALRKVEVVKEYAPVEDRKTSLVVAGGGMGGLMTAAVAALNGVDVVLVPAGRQGKHTNAVWRSCHCSHRGCAWEVLRTGDHPLAPAGRQHLHSRLIQRTAHHRRLRCVGF